MELTCPKCQGAMRSYERSGVTVDQCTECRGIFLDRGELERIMDAEAVWQASEPSSRHERVPVPDGDRSKPRKKRRGSFLEELFD